MEEKKKKEGRDVSDESMKEEAFRKWSTNCFYFIFFVFNIYNLY